MKRTMLSTFAAAAMLSAAASGSATGKTDTSFMLNSEPLHSGNIRLNAPAEERSSTDRSVKTAFTLIELLVVKPKEKGLKANPKGRNAARRGGKKKAK